MFIERGIITFIEMNYTELMPGDKFKFVELFPEFIYSIGMVLNETHTNGVYKFTFIESNLKSFIGDVLYIPTTKPVKVVKIY